MSSELAKVLGFSQITFEAEKMLLRNGPTRSSKIYTTDEPHRLAVHREVYIHLAFTGSKWVAFADPVQQTGWLIEVKISSPLIVTGKNINFERL